MDTKIPLIILGGRDRRGTELPEEGRDKHVLQGYKAVDLEIAGRPLIDILLERLRDCRLFDPIFIAGPRAVYEPVVEGARLIDTDGSFGENIRVSAETVTAEFPERRLAVTTADILPDPADLERALDDYRRHADRIFWMLCIRAPRDVQKLGESAWKPKYGIQPEGEAGPVPVLPGHLVIARPEILRLHLLYRLLDAVYRTRNRPVAYRRAVLVRTFLLELVGKDLRRIFTGRWPTYTWTIVSNGLAIAGRLMSGSIRQGELEKRLSRLAVRDTYRRQHPDAIGRVAVLEGISLAKDIDTEEEAREIARQAALAEPPAAARR